jgi:hypothetical protein
MKKGVAEDAEVEVEVEERKDAVEKQKAMLLVFQSSLLQA